MDCDDDGDGDKPRIKTADSNDDFYTPLKRPDNMAQLQQTGGPSDGRGNMGEGGRARGRGRGDGGRGRGDRPWQGRGGHNNQQQYSGASQTNLLVERLATIPLTTSLPVNSLLP